MSAKKTDRTRECNRSDALQFIQRAENHLAAIELLSTDDELLDSAANLAVSASVNASDAACCARFGEHHRGQDHNSAIDLLEAVSPRGPEMARTSGGFCRRRMMLDIARRRDLPQTLGR